MQFSKLLVGVIVTLCLAYTSFAQLPTIIPTGKPDLINITYTLGYTGNDRHVAFVITAKTRGYIGFGFSNESCMNNSDALVVFKDWNTDELNITDWTFRSTGWPYEKFVDDQQDWTVTSHEWNDDSTTLRFVRLYNTGDPLDVIVEDKTMNLIYSVGEWPALHSHPLDRSGNILFNIIRGVPNY